MQACSVDLLARLRAAAERSEATSGSFPYLKLVVLDPAELRLRAAILRVQVRELALTARIRLLPGAAEPGADAGLAEREEVKIRLLNELRDCARQMAVLTSDGPKPRSKPSVELGGSDPSLREASLDKLRSIRITVETCSRVPSRRS
jgi:hypothetical protein